MRGQARRELRKNCRNVERTFAQRGKSLYGARRAQKHRRAVLALVRMRRLFSGLIGATRHVIHHRRHGRIGVRQGDGRHSERRDSQPGRHEPGAQQAKQPMPIHVRMVPQAGSLENPSCSHEIERPAVNCSAVQARLIKHRPPRMVNLRYSTAWRKPSPTGSASISVQSRPIAMPDRQSHWENVYATKRENEVSWFQETPGPLARLDQCRGRDTRFGDHRHRRRRIAAGRCPAATRLSFPHRSRPVRERARRRTYTYRQRGTQG